MPNTRTITIEVPDYTSLATDTITRINECVAETNDRKYKHMDCIGSIEKQIETYLVEVLMSLKGVPTHRDVKDHCPTTEMYINRSDRVVSLVYALNHKPYFSDDLSDVLLLNVNLETGRCTHEFYKGGYNWTKVDGMGFASRTNVRPAWSGTHKDNLTNPAYIADHVLPALLTKWDSIKRNVNKWVTDEINMSLSAYEKDLADSRKLSSLIADFHI